MSAKVGDRVGAVLSASDGEVKLLGYGVYAGAHIPAISLGGMPGILGERGISNPRIDLDSGVQVWGCECWWGSEEAIKKQIANWADAGMKITLTTIERDSTHNN